MILLPEDFLLCYLSHHSNLTIPVKWAWPVFRPYVKSLECDKEHTNNHGIGLHIGVPCAYNEGTSKELGLKMNIIAAIVILITSFFSPAPITNDLDTSNISITDWCELHHSEGGSADVFFDTVEGASVDAWNDWNDELQQVCGVSHTVSA